MPTQSWATGAVHDARRSTTTDAYQGAVHAVMGDDDARRSSTAGALESLGTRVLESKQRST
jgi:hypothetical protein